MNDLLDAIVALVMRFEGCHLHAYPDPASPLGVALQQRRLWRAVLAGKVAIPADLAHLSGAPWTIGYGETLGVKPGMVWTQETAERRLRERLAQFLLAVYKKCPQLYLEPAGRVIACVSLAYNIGVGAFGASSVCRKTRLQEFLAAADAFLLWRFAQGRELAGLKKRRVVERRTYLG